MTAGVLVAPKFTPDRGKFLKISRYPSASIECLEGAVASGKTVYTMRKVARRIKDAPPGVLHALVGRTERTVINNLVLPLQRILGPDEVVIKYGSGTVMIHGVEVLVFGANNEQAVTKIQGLTLYTAYVDEATNLPESFFNMLYSRLREPGAKLIMTCNPDGPQHWLKTKWLDRCSLHIDIDGRIHVYRGTGRLDLHRYTLNMDDNAHNLPAEYVDRAKRSYSGVFYKRMILCQWVAAEGAIYDAFDVDTHVIPAHRLPANLDPLADGIDYGTTNPTRGIKVMVGPDINGQPGDSLYLVREWAPRTGLTDGLMSAAYRDHRATDPLPSQFTYVDPAAASFKRQLVADGLSGVANGSNDVLPGIRTVASLIAARRLYVVDTCTHAITDLQAYTWDPKATARGEDKPLKVDDHMADAIRYAVYSSRHLWRTRVPVTPAAPDTDTAAAA